MLLTLCGYIHMTSRRSEEGGFSTHWNIAGVHDLPLLLRYAHPPQPERQTYEIGLRRLASLFLRRCPHHEACILYMRRPQIFLILMQLCQNL